MRSTKSPSWIERLLGLEPQPLPSTAFGVDGAGVRAVWREAPGGALQTASVPFETPAFQDGPLGGPVQDEAALGAALDRLIDGMPSPRRASLVVPDAWMRLTFVEALDLPRSGRPREEMLRWRLQQLVPFRIDDLRVRARSLPPIVSTEGSGSAPTVLVGFAIEVLLRSLEDAFAQRGVRIGNIVSESLALLSANGVERTLGLTLTLRRSGYSLLVHRAGVPILARFKMAMGDGDGLLLAPLLREVAMSRRNAAELQPDQEIGASQLFVEDGALAPADLEQLCASLPGTVDVVSPGDVELVTGAAGRSIEAFVPLAAATRGAMA